MPEAERTATNEEFKMMLQLETSLLGWLRTSLSLMGFGFVIARFGFFLREIAVAAKVPVESHPVLASLNTTSGTALIVLGVVVMLISVRNHQCQMVQLKAGELKFANRWSLSVIVCLILCALGMGMAIYLALI